jgi:streptomycin 6-kinase
LLIATKYRNITGLMMALPSFQLPEEVRLKALALGEAGLHWIAELGSVVRALEQKWQLSVVEAPLHGGSASLVLPAVRADGTQTVLKIGIPDESCMLMSQAHVLKLAQGHGYARLFEYDEMRNAILVERLGTPLAQQNLPVQAQIEIICTSLKAAWVTASAPNSLMTGADKAKWLAQFIKDKASELNIPCAKVIKRALEFAASREAAYDPSCCVLVHGDAHAANILQQLTEPENGVTTYKFIDPDGLFAEPACDLAIPMREWSHELVAGDPLSIGQERCALLSTLTGIDEKAIWQWGFIECVSTGLLLLQVGMTDLGTELLAVADCWAKA